MNSVNCIYIVKYDKPIMDLPNHTVWSLIAIRESSQSFWNLGPDWILPILIGRKGKNKMWCFLSFSLVSCWETIVSHFRCELVTFVVGKRALMWNRWKEGLALTKVSRIPWFEILSGPPRNRRQRLLSF